MVRCSICNNALARGRFEKTSSYYHERTTIHDIERSAVSCKYCQILLTTLVEGKVGYDMVISISEYGVSSWTRSMHGIKVSINNPQGRSGFHVELVVSNLLGKSYCVSGLLNSSGLTCQSRSQRGGTDQCPCIWLYLHWVYCSSGLGKRSDQRMQEVTSQLQSHQAEHSPR
jgi:hypothetical protein